MEKGERGVYMPPSALLGTIAQQGAPYLPFLSANQVCLFLTNHSDENHREGTCNHVSCRLLPQIPPFPLSNPDFLSHLLDQKCRAAVSKWYRGVLEACRGTAQGGHRNPSADVLGAQRHFQLAHHTKYRLFIDLVPRSCHFLYESAMKTSDCRKEEFSDLSFRRACWIDFGTCQALVVGFAGNCFDYPITLPYRFPKGR